MKYVVTSGHPAPTSIADRYRSLGIPKPLNLEARHIPSLEENLSIISTSCLLAAPAAAAYYCWQGDFMTATKIIATTVAGPGFYHFQGLLKPYFEDFFKSPGIPEQPLIDHRNVDMGAGIIRGLNVNPYVSTMTAIMGRRHTYGVSAILLRNGFRELPLGELKAKYEEKMGNWYPPSEEDLPTDKELRREKVFNNGQFIY